MNYFFIKWWGPVGATYASFLGLALVFTLRAIDAHRMIGMQVHPGRVLVNAAALVIEAFVLLAETPLYGLWTGIITALIILYNLPVCGPWPVSCCPASGPPRQGAGKCDRRLDRTQEA